MIWVCLSRTQRWSRATWVETWECKSNFLESTKKLLNILPNKYVCVWRCYFLAFLNRLKPFSANILISFGHIHYKSICNNLLIFYRTKAHGVNQMFFLIVKHLNIEFFFMLVQKTCVWIHILSQNLQETNSISKNVSSHFFL